MTVEYADPPNVAPGTLHSVRNDYHVSGRVDGLPIVFLHGTRVDRSIWRPQEDELGVDFKIIAIDLPGHGTLSTRRFRMRDAVEQVRAVIDESAGGRAVVVGLSLGGYVAIGLAAQYPDRVAALTICSATAQPGASVRPAVRSLARLGLTIEAYWPARITDPLSRALPWPSFERTRGIRWIRLDPGVQGILEVLGRPFTTLISAYPGPVLFVNGERDSLIRRGEIQFLRSAKRSSLVVLPSAGHRCNVDSPALFNRAVAEFVRSADWDGVHGGVKQPSDGYTRTRFSGVASS